MYPDFLVIEQRFIVNDLLYKITQMKLVKGWVIILLSHIKKFQSLSEKSKNLITLCVRVSILSSQFTFAK